MCAFFGTMRRRAGADARLPMVEIEVAEMEGMWCVLAVKGIRVFMFL